MKLTEIKLANFRGYLEETKIPFGPNLTVLFGPNGCGKSTVVDAAEWLLSSQIARYIGFEEGRREDYLKHADATNEPYVQAQFDEELILRRERVSTDKAKLRTRRVDGSWLEGKSAAELLASLDPAVVDDQLKSIVFSNSLVSFHVLGQEQLRNFVESDPRDRLERLAPIIGVERYTNFTEAMIIVNRNLSERLKGRLEALNGAKRALNSLDDRKRSALGVYEKSISGDRDLSDWLNDEYEDFRANLPPQLQGEDRVVPRRDLRETLTYLEHLVPVVLAAVRQYLSGVAAKLSAAQELRQLVELYGQKRSALSSATDQKSLQNEIARLFNQKDVIQKDVERLQNQLRQSEMSVSDQRETADAVTELKAKFELIGTITPAITARSNSRKILATKIQDIQSDLDAQIREEQDLEVALTRASERIHRLQELLTKQRDALRTVQSIVNREPQIDETRGRIKILDQRLTSPCRLMSLISVLRSLQRKAQNRVPRNACGRLPLQAVNINIF